MVELVHVARTRQATRNWAIPIYRWFLSRLTINVGTGLASVSGAIRAAIASCRAFRLPEVGRIDAFTGNSSLVQENKATTVFASKIGEFADLLRNCMSPES